MSRIFRQEAHILSSEVDPYLRLRSSALFRYLQEISIEHSESIGAGRSKTLDRGILWVMSRMHAVITRMPVYGEHIVLETWPGETMHLLFPRHYRILAESGETLVQASCLWLLMDAQTRRMTFPEPHGICVEGLVTGGELPLPEAFKLPELPDEARRAVRYSEIDLNGHVNNTRYLDWLDDLIPLSGHRDLAWKELNINYLSEIPPESEVTLQSSAVGDMFYVLGSVADKQAFRIAARR